jgi:hypothetical protein
MWSWKWPTDIGLVLGDDLSDAREMYSKTSRDIGCSCKVEEAGKEGDRLYLSHAYYP